MPHGRNGAPDSASVPGKMPANQVAAAGGGKPPPFWANWGQQWNNTSQNMRKNASTWVRDMEGKARTVKMPKMEMPGEGNMLFQSQTSVGARGLLLSDIILTT